MCLVCGRDNPFGLHARFFELAPDESAAADAPRSAGATATAGPAAGRELLGVFTPREEHQSYPGRLHGGVSSAILDETIGRAILLVQPGAWGVTAEFTVRFRKPLPLDGEIRCVARLTRDTSRLFEGSGEILLPDGSIAVEASGKYVKMTITGITDDDFAEREWFTDPREAPDFVDL
jgi:acyl-coenzyme A thioesterase PaaI-like protein